MGLEVTDLIVCIDISDIQNELVYKDFEPCLDDVKTSWINKYLLNNSFIFRSLKEIRRQNDLKEFYKEAKREKKNPKTDLYAGFFDNFHSSELLCKQEFHNIAMWYLNKDLFEKWGREGMILEKWYMAKLADLCKERNISLNVLIYPWPVQIAAGERNSIQVQFWSNFCNQYPAELINLFPLFMERNMYENVVSNYFIKGDVHFNKAGHAVVADEILRALN